MWVLSDIQLNEGHNALSYTFCLKKAHSLIINSVTGNVILRQNIYFWVPSLKTIVEIRLSPHVLRGSSLHMTAETMNGALCIPLKSDSALSGKSGIITRNEFEFEEHLRG